MEYVLCHSRFRTNDVLVRNVFVGECFVSGTFSNKESLIHERNNNDKKQSSVSL